MFNQSSCLLYIHFSLLISVLNLYGVDTEACKDKSQRFIQLKLFELQCLIFDTHLLPFDQHDDMCDLEMLLPHLFFVNSFNYYFFYSEKASTDAIC